MLHFEAEQRRECRQRLARIVDGMASTHGGDYAKELMKTLKGGA